VSSTGEFEAEHPEYRRCRLLSVEDAIRSGRLRALEVLSPGRAGSSPPPIFSNMLPFQFAYWGRAFFGASGDETVSREGQVQLARARDVHIVAPDVGVMLGNADLLDMYSQFIQAHRPESQFRRVDGHLFVRQGPSEHHKGVYFLGCTPSSLNYAHWVTESLPFWVTYAFRFKAQGVRLVLGEISKFHQEALELLGIGPDDIFSVGSGSVEFEELLFASPLSLWSPPSIVHDAAQEIVRRVGGYPRPESRQDRIFLSRKDVAERRLLNEDQAISRLADYRIRPVLCSELSFAEQVRMITSTSMVIGVHGAALGNILFCSRGAQILELFPEYCVQPHFRALAARAGLDYGFVQGTSFEYEDSRQSGNAWGQDFVIDIDVLVRAVQFLVDRERSRDD
jgi:hypothetical protein